VKADPEAPAVALPGAGEAAARGGALRTTGFALSAALSLLTLPLMVRHLGVAGFGRWLSVIVLVNVVALAAELGLNALALREYPLRDAADRSRLLGSILGLRIALIAAGVVLALAFAALAGWGSTLVEGVLIA
jgi:O-antigen/teichoic acid export membrane protein